MKKKRDENIENILSHIDSALRRSASGSKAIEEARKRTLANPRLGLSQKDKEFLHYVFAVYDEEKNKCVPETEEEKARSLAYAMIRAKPLFAVPFTKIVILGTRYSRIAQRLTRRSTRESTIEWVYTLVRIYVRANFHAEQHLSINDDSAYRSVSESDAKLRTDPLCQALVKVLRRFNSLVWRPTQSDNVFLASLPDHSLVPKVELRKLPKESSYHPVGLPVPDVGILREQFGLNCFDPSDAILALYAIERLVQSKEDVIELSLDELLCLEGNKSCYRPGFRKEQADRFHKVLHLCSRMCFTIDKSWLTGEAWSKEARGVEYQESPPFKYHHVRFLSSEYRACFIDRELDEPPHPLFAIGASPYIHELRKGHGSSWIGKIGRIASIPAGHLSGRWAKAIALTLLMHARNNPRQSLNGVRLKRSTLIEGAVTEGSSRYLLPNEHPERGHEHFRTAIKKLKKIGVVSACRDGSDDLGRGWQQRWHDQVVEIELGESYLEELRGIAGKFRTATPSPKGKRSKKRSS